MLKPCILAAFWGGELTVKVGSLKMRLKVMVRGQRACEPLAAVQLRQLCRASMNNTTFIPTMASALEISMIYDADFELQTHGISQIFYWIQWLFHSTDA